MKSSKFLRVVLFTGFLLTGGWHAGPNPPEGPDPRSTSV